MKMRAGQHINNLPWIMLNDINFCFQLTPKIAHWVSTSMKKSIYIQIW